MSNSEWRKSTRSGLNGCVEVAFLDGAVAVRDSKDRGGPVLRYTFHEWATFVQQARSGAFELSGMTQQVRPSRAGQTPMTREPVGNLAWLSAIEA